jgi:hypothetical protein
LVFALFVRQIEAEGSRMYALKWVDVNPIAAISLPP